MLRAAVNEEAFPPPIAAPIRVRDGISVNVTAGIFISLFFVFVFGSWIATSSIAGAIIASGTVVVENNLKKIQHQSGGIVDDILVRNGDRVEAGRIVARLDQTLSRATLEITSNQLDRVRIRKARLNAEAAGLDTISVPDPLKARERQTRTAEMIDGERRLFDSRRRALAGQRSALEARVEQYREQIEGLEAQKNASEESLAILSDDLKTIRSLFSQKLVSLERITNLNMDIIQQKGEIGRLVAASAEARGRISETLLQIIQIEDSFRKDANAELRDIEAREAELVERLSVAEDQLSKTEIRSPQSGVVQELSVHTIGGVVAPGDTLMMIVPDGDNLVIDAQIPPGRIDEVEPGQLATIRFSSFDRNTTPECHGTLRYISPDLIKNENLRIAYYSARISIKQEPECKQTVGKLIPGMPVEIHMQTGSRTILSYLLKPLTDQFSRSMKD